MKSIFDKSTRDELIDRINLLNDKSSARWGKMNGHQMLAHCVKWEDMALGNKKYKQSFLGKLFGKMALKDFIKDDSPFKQNVPTVPEFKIKEKTGDTETQKNKWVSLLKQYEHFNNDNFIHPFLGELTKEQIGILAYKHTDHHLRQFNV